MASLGTLLVAAEVNPYHSLLTVRSFCASCLPERVKPSKEMQDHEAMHVFLTAICRGYTAACIQLCNIRVGRTAADLPSFRHRKCKVIALDRHSLGFIG